MPEMSSRGSLESDVKHFPSSYDSLMAKCKAEVEMFRGVATGDSYSAPFFVGNTTGFSVYVKGSGTCTVQVSPTPNEDLWCAIGTEGTFTSATTGLAKSWIGPYGWVRVKLDNASNMQVFLYRKYFIN